MSLYRFVDNVLTWYIHTFRRARPSAPMLVEDYLHLMKQGPERFFVDSPRGLWSPERQRFPTPVPLDWADEAVNTAHISPLIPPPPKAQTAVLWVHGFLMDDELIQRFALKGITHAAPSVLTAAHYLLRLPLHFERKQRWKGKLVGAEWTFQNAPFRLLEVIALGVNEAREFIHWWLNKRTGNVVVVGISLGGNVAGWVPVLEDNERVGALPFVPAIDLPQVFSQSPLVKPLREGFIGDVGLIERYLGKWSPFNQPLAAPSERVFVIAGAEDGILPSPQLIGGLEAGAPCTHRDLRAWENVCVQALYGGHSSWALPFLRGNDVRILAAAITRLMGKPQITQKKSAD